MAKETGRVQTTGEAFVTISFSQGEKTEFLIDTGFNGALTIPEALATELNLKTISEVEILGAGQYKTVYKLSSTEVFWLGGKRKVEVLINDGEDFLIGTEMLQDCVLQIDYRNKRVTIDNQ